MTIVKNYVWQVDDTKGNSIEERLRPGFYDLLMKAGYASFTMFDRPWIALSALAGLVHPCNLLVLMDHRTKDMQGQFNVSAGMEAMKIIRQEWDKMKSSGGEVGDLQFIYYSREDASFLSSSTRRFYFGHAISGFGVRRSSITLPTDTDVTASWRFNSGDDFKKVMLWNHINPDMIDDWGLMQHSLTREAMDRILLMIRARGMSPVLGATSSAGCAHLVERIPTGLPLARQAAEIITIFSRYDALFMPAAIYNAQENVLARYEMEIVSGEIPVESWLKDCLVSNLINDIQYNSI